MKIGEITNLKNIQAESVIIYEKKTNTPRFNDKIRQLGKIQLIFYAILINNMGLNWNHI